VSATPIFKDLSRSTTERVEDLLSQMTLDEKIAQMGSCWVYQLLEKLEFSPAKAQPLLSSGIGHVTRVGGASNVLPAESAVLTNRIQKFLIENTRLGIPAVVHEECCSGYMARGATVFPQAIGVASAWEPELVEAMSDAIRAQMRSIGAHHALSPVLDITRDARWGRTEETFGEDPYLVARLGVAYIKGLQGPDLRNGVAATGKHFVGYGMSEGGMNWAPPHLAPRELREVYLFPFEAAVREAGMASIMNAYHELDGVPCGSSKELLTTILREQWGFNGTVVSDYFAIAMLYNYHHIAADRAKAAFLALDAGLDVELPSSDCYDQPLKEAIQKGSIPLALVDQSVRRILTQKFALGLFDNPFVDEGAVNFDTPEQRQLARRIAERSMVLLKNEPKLLPLNKALKSIAVIGPNANSTRNLFGDYAYPAHMETLLELKTNGNVFNQPIPEGLESVEDFIPAITILDAIKSKVGPQTQVHYAPGCDVIGSSTEGFAAAVEAARKSQIAILVVGDKAGLTDDCTSGEARDRAVLDLPGVQAALVKAILDTGTPVVLVLINGRPVTLGALADSVPAILDAWFPAEEGASAVADVLFGDVNPGGKLPMTFPRAVGQVPVFYGHRPSGGRSHWKGNYVETSNKPLYPFGFGLSYTKFAFSNLRISPAVVRCGESFTVQIDVANVGDVAGDEVVQLYTHQFATRVTRPVKELKAFRRISVEPGQTRTVTFTLPVNLLGFYDADDVFVVEPGTVDLMVGSSSADIHATGTIEIQGVKTPVEKAFFSESSVR